MYNRPHPMCSGFSNNCSGKQTKQRKKDKAPNKRSKRLLSVSKPNTFIFSLPFEKHNQKTMISLKAIQTCFITTKHEFYHKTDFSTKNHHHHHHSRLLFLCKSKDSDANTPPQPPPSEGDARKQDLLARIAMLQAQKVRLTDYLDERSAYLTQFAEEANVEFDQVGENALKELEEASARIMGNIESQMQAFEESAESSKMEIEENQKKLDEFENRFVNERNEGLFFKSLGDNKPVDKSIAKAAGQKLNELNKQTAGTETRRNIYLALIGLVSVSIVESVISASSDWRKSVILGVILVGLLTQLTYEQKMLAETESKESERNQEKKE